MLDDVESGTVAVSATSQFRNPNTPQPEQPESWCRLRDDCPGVENHIGPCIPDDGSRAALTRAHDAPPAIAKSDR